MSKRKISIIIPLILSIIPFSLLSAEGLYADFISLNDFDLFLGGNCAYHIQNNSSKRIIITSFKITPEIDVINSEFSPPGYFSLDPGQEKGAVYADPRIENICFEAGREYMFNAILSYKVGENESEFTTRRISGVCSEWR